MSVFDLTETQRELLPTAALIAAKLHKHDGVQGIQVAPILYRNDGPPFYIVPKLRLFVIVTAEKAAEYANDLRNPYDIHFMDGDDGVPGNVWEDKKRATAQDVALSHLGSNEAEDFYGSFEFPVDELDDYIWPGEVSNEFDIVLAKEGWATEDGKAELLALHWIDEEGRQWPVFGDTVDLEHNIEHRQVFDPATSAFKNAA